MAGPTASPAKGSIWCGPSSTTGDEGGRREPAPTGSVAGYAAQRARHMVPLGRDARHRALATGPAIPVVGIAHVGFDPVQERMHPVELEHAFLRLNDDMRLLPLR